MKEYSFESANKGTVTVSITGEYRDGCKDVNVAVEQFGDMDFEEIDGGGIDEIMDYLVNVVGVKFANVHSMMANYRIIGSVMLDGDSTVEDEIAKAAGMPAGEAIEWAEWKGYAEAVA